MADLEQVLGDNPSPEPETIQPEPTPEPAPEPQNTAEQEPAPEEVTEDVQPQPEKAEPTVPLAAMLAERDKARGLETRLSVLEQQIRQPAPPAELPDVLENPDGYAEIVSKRVDSALENQRLNMSQAFAELQFGKEKVATAFEALQSSNDPAARAAIANSPMPYVELMQWHQKQAALAEIGDDPAAYRDRLKAEVLKEVQAELVAEEAKKAAATPAPTLSNQPNLGNRSGPEFAPANLAQLLGG